MDEIERKVVDIIADQAVLEPTDVKMTDTMEDLGIDSMGLVECIFAIEETFDISVPFNANDASESDFDISSVQTVCNGVKRLLAVQNT